MEVTPAPTMQTSCRFADGYVADLDLAPPPAAQGLPHVFAFEADRSQGYTHYGKHYRASGAAIVELLQTVWAFTVHTVLRDVKCPAAALIWVLDGSDFRALLDTGRMKVVTERCSGYGGDAHCRNGCAERLRPDRHTLRSVQECSALIGAGEVLYSRLSGTARDDYLTGSLERYVGMRLEIGSYPQLQRAEKQSCECLMSVPVDCDGQTFVMLAMASRPQLRMIREDPERFVERHQLMMIERLPSGHMRNRFVERQS